jgi:nucleotide-binding universal stress UspA family protein
MDRAFRKILLAFDNSEASRVALQKACDISSKFGSEITALFVSSGDDSSFADSKKFLEDFASSKGSELRIVEKSGKVHSEVIKLEREGDYDLILVGSHGKKGWQPFWMGSNAFKVISSSTCPVICTQEKASELSFNNILLPLADSSASRQKVPYCTLLAQAFGSTVHVLGVSKGKSKDTMHHVNSYIRQTERYLSERGIKYTVGTEFGVKVPEACIEYGAKVNAGLMLIMTETESAGVFMDSYSQQLVNSSPIPVMSVHSRDTRLTGAAGY